MLVLPELAPQSVEQLAGEVDEELSLIQQEAQLKLQVRQYSGQLNSLFAHKLATVVL